MLAYINKSTINYIFQGWLFLCFYVCFTLYLTEANSWRGWFLYFKVTPFIHFDNSAYFLLLRISFATFFCSFFIYFVGLYGNVFCVKNLFYAYKKISNLFVSCWAVIKNLDKKQAYFLLFIFSIIIFVRVFLWFYLAIHIDEYTSVLIFVHGQPPTFAMRWYLAGGNNHILLSVLSYVFVNFFQEPIICIRFISFVSSLLNSYILFVFFKKYYGYSNAIIALLLFNSFTAFNYYATIGRGYAIHTLCATISFMCLYLIICNNNRKLFYYVLSASTIIGFWAIPSYLYIATSFYFLLFVYFLCIKKQVKNVYTVFISGLWVGVGVAFLYTEILLNNGVDSFINPNDINFMKVGFEELLENYWKYTTAVIHFRYGFSELYATLLFLLLFFINLFYVIFTKNTNQKFLGIGVLFLQMLPTISYLIHRVHIPYRIWSSLQIISVYQIIWLISCISHYYKKNSQYSSPIYLPFVYASFLFLFLSQSYLMWIDKGKNSEGVEYVGKIIKKYVKTATFSTNDWHFLKIGIYHADKTHSYWLKNIISEQEIDDNTLIDIVVITDFVLNPGYIYTSYKIDYQKRLENSYLKIKNYMQANEKNYDKIKVSDKVKVYIRKDFLNKM